jgi:dTDP-4-dehydrorhamnose 3,5-epimerase
MISTKPTLIKGLLHADSRGSLWFNNPAGISEFQRLYIIENSLASPLRGWHGHKLESKGFICVSGRIRIGAVQVDDWASPSESLDVFSADLGSGTSDFVYVPAGYANAILSLDPGSRVLVMSSSSLAESQGDDFRYPLGTWTL